MSEVKDAKPEGAAPKSSKVLPILVGVNSLLLIAVLGFLGYQLTKKPHAEDPPAAHAGDEAAPEAPEGEGHEKPAKAEKAEKTEKGEAKKEGHEAPKEGHEGATAGKAVTGLGPMVKLADFVVHLRNPEVDRYARMSFDVEVFADPDKDSLNAHMPKVRDAFISYLSDRTLEELQGAEGLGRTKDALQTRLRELVPEARVRSLYISDFVVQ